MINVVWWEEVIVLVVRWVESDEWCVEKGLRYNELSVVMNRECYYFFLNCLVFIRLG